MIIGIHALALADVTNIVNVKSYAPVNKQSQEKDVIALVLSFKKTS